jgi:flavin reductase (DIM6/NTAB) family NADH-FMN oxidoreductase RutF
VLQADLELEHKNESAWMENYYLSDEYISWKPVTTANSVEEQASSSLEDAALRPGAPIIDGGSAAESHQDGTTFITTTLLPRPTAWIAVYPAADDSTKSPSESDGDSDAPIFYQPLVALVEGYCGASDRPPTLMLGSDSLPSIILNGLRRNRVCTLSVATEREIWAVKSMVASKGEKSGPAKTFREARLEQCSPPIVLSCLPCPNNGNSETGGSNYWKRPPAVEHSPVHMHCRLILDVPLETNKVGNGDEDSSMLLLQIDTYVIKGEVLRTQSRLYPGQPTIHGNPDVRNITAKIDCLLLRPLASLGNGKFGRVGCIYHMRRPMPLPKTSRKIPLKHEDSARYEESSDLENDLNENTCNNTSWETGSMWEIDQLVLVDSIYKMNFNTKGDGETITYTYRLDTCCPLGYNPMKQVVCPRFIGWISTYEPISLRYATNGYGKRQEDLVHHISPYSFFIDVARGSRPMVAFAACPRSDEFADSDDDESSPAISDQCNSGSDDRKDAWRDVEDTRVFCVNLVSEELAWAMNASAAPLGKGLSEFRLMESQDAYGHLQRSTPTSMPAPSIDAPFVPQSPMFMECRYVKTGDDLYKN